MNGKFTSEPGTVQEVGGPCWALQESDSSIRICFESQDNRRVQDTTEPDAETQTDHIGIVLQVKWSHLILLGVQSCPESHNPLPRLCSQAFYKLTSSLQSRWQTEPSGFTCFLSTFSFPKSGAASF